MEWGIIGVEGFILQITGMLLGLVGFVILCAYICYAKKRDFVASKVAVIIGTIFVLAAAIMVPIGFSKDMRGNCLSSLSEGVYEYRTASMVWSDEHGQLIHITVNAAGGSNTSDRGALTKHRCVDLPYDAYIVANGERVSLASGLPGKFMADGLLVVHKAKEDTSLQEGGHEWQSSESSSFRAKIYEFSGGKIYNEVSGELEEMEEVKGMELK